MPYPSLPGLPEGASVSGVIDYDIKKVEWNKYELKSGLTVCFLALPQMVFTTNKVDPNGAPIYGISWSTFLTRVIASEKETGAPTIYNPQTDFGKVPSLLEETLTNSEPWNEFYLKDGHTLRARSVVTQIRRLVKSFDPLNMPIFSIMSQQIVDIVLTERDKNSPEI